MKILSTILFLLPLSVYCQTMTDSTNVINPSNQVIIRFTTSYQSMPYINGDSLRFRGTTTKRLGLVSPLDLPVNTATTTALSGKQTTLVSGTNIKTVNGNTLLGSGDIVIGGGVAWGAVTGTLSNQTDLQNALNAKQATITTGTTAQYFRGDLSLATFPTTTASFSNSTNKNFVTDAQGTVIGNTSGTNTGDNATNSQYSGLVSNANHTGDATGSTALTLATVNSNVGSFGSATQAGTFTVNGKGLITAASNTTIAIPESAVTNLTTDLAAKAPLVSPSFTTPNIGVATGTSLAVTGNITSSAGGIGYVTGNGGAVTQLTSKSTTVILNKLAGDITMINSALAAATIVSFTLTNSTIAATDIIHVQHQATGTFGAYTITGRTAAGSAVISVRNNTAGSLGEAIAIRFIVIKSTIN